MNTATIATHLNVLESAITKVEEWANCLFVVVKGLGARFVSKKVVTDKPSTIEYTWSVPADSLVCRRVGQKFRIDGQGYEVTKILSHGPFHEDEGVTYHGYADGYGMREWYEWTCELTAIS